MKIFHWFLWNSLNREIFEISEFLNLLDVSEEILKKKPVPAIINHKNELIICSLGNSKNWGFFQNFDFQLLVFLSEKELSQETLNLIDSLKIQQFYIQSELKEQRKMRKAMYRWKCPCNKLNPAVSRRVPHFGPFNSMIRERKRTRNSLM